MLNKRLPLSRCVSLSFSRKRESQRGLSVTILGVVFHLRSQLVTLLDSLSTMSLSLSPTPSCKEDPRALQVLLNTRHLVCRCSVRETRKSCVLKIDVFHCANTVRGYSVKEYDVWRAPMATKIDSHVCRIYREELECLMPFSFSAQLARTPGFRSGPAPPSDRRCFCQCRRFCRSDPNRRVEEILLVIPISRFTLATNEAAFRHG